MRVLVTGGAGFIGGHSCRLLRERGHEVVALDDLSTGKRENLPEGVGLELLDVRSPARRAAIERIGPDAVLHLAAQMDVRRSVADPVFDASINVLGTVNLLDALRRTGVKRLVFASSGGAIYGEQEAFPATEAHPRRPDSPYGVSKLCAEEYISLQARAYGLSTLALRYANVYGPAQDPHGEAGVVAIFVGRLLAGEPAVINGTGLQTRDYVFVEDVARLNVAALESDVRGALNAGTGRETSVDELARLLTAAVGRPASFGHGPAKPGEQLRSVVDASAARARLGWEPRVAMEDGLARTARWFEARVPVTA
jgi:UDP-glucose 4-epimerase